MALSGSLSALILLANAVVDPTQIISILAAAVPSDTNLTVKPSTDDYVKAVQYETVASFLRQCETYAVQYDHTVLAAAYEHHMQNKGSNEWNRTSKTGGNDGGRNGGNTGRCQGRIRITLENVKRAKNKSQCKRCGSYGHLYTDQNQDGSLKHGETSSYNPITTDGSGNNTGTDSRK